MLLLLTNVMSIGILYKDMYFKTIKFEPYDANIASYMISYLFYDWIINVTKPHIGSKDSPIIFSDDCTFYVQNFITNSNLRVQIIKNEEDISDVQPVAVVKQNFNKRIILFFENYGILHLMFSENDDFTDDETKDAGDSSISTLSIIMIVEILVILIAIVIYFWENRLLKKERLRHEEIVRSQSVVRTI